MNKKNNVSNPATWQPAVELDLETASTRAFEEILERFYAWSEKQPPLGPLNIKSGWYTVDPQMAEDLLRRNVCNRHPSFSTICKYNYSMRIGEWRKTGQPLVCNNAGKLNEGQQRCWASYLGKVSFETYIVTDAPSEDDLFAFYDDVKPRSAADALETSGLNGAANHLAVAIQLAFRYEHGALGILKQPKIRKLNNREVLHYSQNHPGLNEIAHQLLANYGKAVTVIKNKGVAIFFAERVTALYGEDALDHFLVPLGNGANLEEDSPILGLRNRLLSEDKINKERVLALTIKAFTYFMDGTKLKKGNLYVKDNEKFPHLEVLSSNE